MRTLLCLIAAALPCASLIPGTPMREIEDRAANGEECAISALRDSASAGSLRAMNYLGFLYWQGKGTRLDRDSALMYLRNASAAGDAKASANLGHLLLAGSPECRQTRQRLSAFLITRQDADLPPLYGNWQTILREIRVTQHLPEQ